MGEISDEGLIQFNQDGYLVIDNFATDCEVDAMRRECKDLVDGMDPHKHNTVFSGTKQSYRDAYFMNSADKIGFFFEDNAKDESGKLLVDKHLSVHKIGHALHKFCPVFKDFTYNDKVQGLVRRLGFVDPVICQSMYIFKQPRIGGAAVPHQDGTFLYVEPLKVVGLWLALEDATLENGCLWFIPGSHTRGIDNGRRMVRNPENTGPTTIFTAEEAKYNDSDFVAAPVKKGSLIVIHGTVVHKSEGNTSDKSRHIYTFHIYEQHEAVWSDKNWLQPTEAGVFSHLYAET